MSAEAPTRSGSRRSSTGDSGSNGSLKGGGGRDLGDAIVLVVIALVEVDALAGDASYLVVAAPRPPVDAAFGAAVTGGFAKGVRRAQQDSGWTASIVAMSCVPLAVAGLVLLVAAFLFQNHFPDPHSLGEALRSL